MMNGAKRYRGLVNRCFMLYSAIGLIVISGMLLSNRFVSHASHEQLKNTAIGVAGGYTLLLMLLWLFTYFRLSVVLFSKLPPLPTSLSVPQKQEVWHRLVSFPNELFWFYWLIGVTIAQSYRLTVAGPPPWYGEAAIHAWKGILFDGSTFFAFAMIHYSLLRWLLHRQLKELDIVHLPQMRFFRMTNRMIMIVACGMLYAGLRLFWYSYQAVNSGVQLQWGIFAMISMIIIVVTLVAMKLAASYLLTDMNRIKNSLQQLQRSHNHSIKPISIVSPYEAGELALAFNSLQHRFVEEYSRLQEEIQLAQQVKQQLLPEVKLLSGQWQVVGSQDQSRLSEHPFQMAEQQGENIVMAAGAIRGNAPSAALVMSSLLMLFRAQASNARSAEQLINYINRQLADVLARTMELHIIVASLECSHNRLEWAMAGEVQLLLGDEEIRFSSAGASPIGSPITASFSCGSSNMDSMEQFQLQIASRPEAARITGHRRVISP